MKPMNRGLLRRELRAALSVLAASLAAVAHAQNFNTGSDGSYGAINVTGTTNLPIPANGVFNCTTITVATGQTLGFVRNPLNTPVYLLATGDVVINGTIDVSGYNSSGSPPSGGLGGPGGFDGGMPGSDPSGVPPGSGLGPGAGKGGQNNSASNAAGAGSYGALATGGNTTNHGVIYGSPLLIPLVGGSGGGGTTGTPGAGGGGGGGAVLIASNTRILLVGGRVAAVAGNASASAYNGGSGGAIRLVAPVVAGNGTLDVGGRNGGGPGRVRVDTLDRSGMNFVIYPANTTTVGGAMFLFANPVPRLDVIQAAGTAIAEGASAPVTVVLPFGANTNQTITVQGRNFSGVVPINLVLTPENGVPAVYPTQIDQTASNPATTTVNVTFPVNVRTIINAWTR